MAIYKISHVFFITDYIYSMIYSVPLDEYCCVCFVLSRCLRVIVPSQCLGSAWATRSQLWPQEQSHISYLWATGELFNNYNNNIMKTQYGSSS